MLYLLHEAPPEEQNFSMVMEMISAAEVHEDDDNYQSPLDILFERLEMREPDSIACKQYRIFKQAAGKTAKSILVSVGVRLAAFNLPSIAKLTMTDELHLQELGERKIALFCCIPDSDKSLNYLVGMIYTQLIQTLYAIVGTGYFGAELGRIMKTKEGAKIVAVYDPENGAAIAAELGCDNESSLESICARPDVDAVIVATPNYLHKEPVLEAARNHKNVFCEKPIALSYADCDEMVNTCKENNVVFMAGHVMNFFHGVRLAKKFIQEGRIGKVLYAHSARNGWEEPQPSISWKKIRSKSGGHLYHHIHELDCIQFIMGPATRVTMTGGNVAHSGPEFGDEDDMLFLNLEFGNNTYAIVEYGSAFHWPEHYVLIQGTKGAIRIDMCNVGMTVKLADGTEEHYCVHANKEIDDDRTRIYHSTEMDGAIQYGHPGKKPPMWLNSIMNAEMEFFNGVMHGDPIPDEFKPLMTGEAARAAIATADAATLSLRENRKVSVEEVMK